MQSALLRDKRRSMNMSQTELATKIGFNKKGAQFISNIERNMCGIPYKKLSAICGVLELDRETLKQAIIMDAARDLDRVFNGNM